MTLSVVFTKKFKKDFQQVLAHQKRLLQLRKIIQSLSEGKSLEITFHDHPLKGNYKDFRECHIEPDFLLIYKIENESLILVRCGSHSELFR